jgi:hypothetical protein
LLPIALGSLSACVSATTLSAYPHGQIQALPIASAGLSRRVGRVVAYPPLCEMGDLQRCEFQEALLDADAFEDLPGKCKWQAAILKAEGNRPNLRFVGCG